MDYMGTFAMKENAIWYGFGPSVEQLIGNFQSFKIPREERVPSVAYLGLDCMPSRAGILNEISKIFPVTSIGGCANNFEKPEGDPGRGGREGAKRILGAIYVLLLRGKRHSVPGLHHRENVGCVISRLYPGVLWLGWNRRISS